MSLRTENEVCACLESINYFWAHKAPEMNPYLVAEEIGNILGGNTSTVAAQIVVKLLQQRDELRTIPAH